MSLQDPLVSVLIPSYNHESYLQKALESVWKQNYANVEIVVVDDCSTDRSWELLQELAEQPPLPMAIHRNPENLGITKTLNRALSVARGELVAFLASDDVVSEDRFSQSVGLFFDAPLLQAVFANGRILRDGRIEGRIHKTRALKLLSQSPEKTLHTLYTDSSPLFIQTALFRASRLEEIGGFDSQTLADDWLLITRFFESAKSAAEYVYLDQDVIFYRQHDSNVHKNSERHEQLKVDFVERHTPNSLKAEAFSNIYYWIACQRLKKGQIDSALSFYKRSQTSRFHWNRTAFMARWVWAWLAAKILPAQPGSSD